MIDFDKIWILLGVAAILYGIARFLCRIVIRYGPSWGVMDMPGERRAHTIPVPRFGGLSLFPALILGGIAALIFKNYFEVPNASNDLNFFSNLMGGLLMGLVGMFSLGAIDDFRGVRVRFKLFFQILIAIAATFFIPDIVHLRGWSVSPIAAKFIVVSWLVVVSNSVNLLDGIDGLAGILFLAFLSVISIISLASNDYAWLFMTVPTGGAVFGFLKYNWNPAKIFLGDSGSLMIGFFIAYASITVALIPSDPLSEYRLVDWRMGLSLTLASIFIIDTAMAVMRRVFNDVSSFQLLRHPNFRNFKEVIVQAVARIWVPDRNHLHHKFLRWGFRVPQAASLIMLFYFGILLLAIPVRAAMDHEVAQAFSARLVSLGIFATSLISGIIFYTYFSAMKMRRHRQAIARILSATLNNTLDTNERIDPLQPQWMFSGDSRNLSTDPKHLRESPLHPPAA